MQHRQQRTGTGIRNEMIKQRSIESSLQKKKSDQQDKKKPLLLKQLQNELKHLDDLDDQDFQDDKDPYINDSTLDRLQMISKQASKLQIKQIQKLCRLAIGKRILNIQLKKKKDEHNSKKQKIELFFRENRIKRYDYQNLIEQKLLQSTLIVRAYQNGKGFIQSDRLYHDRYQKALIECNYMNVIKQVNKIFYQNYSGIKNNNNLIQIILKLIWIPIIIFLILGITLPFISFNYQQQILIGLLSIILISLLYVSIRTFIDKPNQNNQIQQSIDDVKKYFIKINQEFLQNGNHIQWICSYDFMYLEVIFHSGFPT